MPPVPPRLPVREETQANLECALHLASNLADTIRHIDLEDARAIMPDGIRVRETAHEILSRLARAVHGQGGEQ